MGDFDADVFLGFRSGGSVVVGMWLLNIGLAEWVVRRLALPRPL